jgi:hypothetical protein
MDNETGERRALVHNIDVQYGTGWYGEEATALDLPLTITVLRGPYWENTTVRNLPDSAPSAAACVAYDYTAAGDVVSAHDIVGDAGARIRYFELNPNGIIERFWMGIRSANKHGSTGISNFIKTWELEDGTNATDATDTVDATASGGYNVTVSESGIDWDAGNFYEVLRISLSDVTSNEEDNFGKFLSLMRAKTASSTTWECRYWITHNVATFQRIRTDPVEINSSSWLNYEMAVIKVGSRDYHAVSKTDYSPDEEQSFTILIEARRTSGSGDLNLDCLIPIPVDEGFIKIDSNASQIAQPSTYFGQSPEGHFVAVQHDTTTGDLNQLSFIDSVNNFSLPPGDGRIYCVYERVSASSITATVIFNDADSGRYYERWLSLRGSE